VRFKRLFLGLLFASSVTAASQCTNLKAWYDSYNTEYFDDTLPKDIVIERVKLPDRVLARTVETHGQFHIQFNKTNNMGADYEHLTLLHESCHIKTWDESAMHGKDWAACMYMLQGKKAFTDLLVEGYKDRE
jgi:hypothetical protein